MKIIKNTIHFKSSDKYYDDFYNKEKYGIKSNTVRGLDQIEILCVHGLVEDIQYICIHSDKTGYYFQRKLTDVSYYDGRYIFSW